MKAKKARSDFSTLNATQSKKTSIILTDEFHSRNEHQQLIENVYNIYVYIYISYSKQRRTNIKYVPCVVRAKFIYFVATFSVYRYPFSQVLLLLVFFYSTSLLTVFVSYLLRPSSCQYESHFRISDDVDHYSRIPLQSVYTSRFVYLSSLGARFPSPFTFVLTSTISSFDYFSRMLHCCWFFVFFDLLPKPDTGVYDSAGFASSKFRSANPYHLPVLFAATLGSSPAFNNHLPVTCSQHR